MFTDEQFEASTVKKILERKKKILKNKYLKIIVEDQNVHRPNEKFQKRKNYFI